MQCPRCEQDAPPDAQFCPECGAALVPVCPRCGTPNLLGHKFCKQCGQPLATFPHEAAKEPREEPTAEAERRQLTVMFCDLVGSTALAEQLDPEEMRETVRAYQGACARVIDRFDGHIAQYLGDGLLVYFGYPRAHEDDALRAVRAGLGMLRAMEELNARREADRRARLPVRVGVHTGLVVVGEVGSGARHERLALGETPNVAARLQALADPDTVMISESTHRLVEGLLACQDLGAQPIKGISTPVQVYRVLADGVAQSRLEVAAVHGLTPLVAREQEVELLLGRWEQARDGLGQVVLLKGDPGIGKSRLVEVLKARVAAGGAHTRWECRCSPYHHDSALYPVIDLFERALGFDRDDSPKDKIGKIGDALTRYGLANAENVALWASLLSVSVADRYPPLGLTPQRQRQRMLEAVLALLLALAARQPVLVIVEDLHWVDPSTLELLTLIVEQAPAAAVLAVLTFRPDFEPPWPGRAYLSSLTVNRFTRRQTEQMVQRVTAGKALPAEVLQQVVTRTDGVPLFVEELTKMVIESGLLSEQSDHYELTGPLPPLAIPTTLQDSLMARLDRLATAKDVAQLGATLGRSFSYELLRAVSLTEEPALRHALDRLVEAELLYQRGVPPQATYVFKHALIQEAAYQSLLKSRRQQFHQRIAQVLAERFPETVETQPEMLAHHYTEAGLAAPAVEYWRRAGERAATRSAHVEAIAHVTRGLDVLKTLPESSERHERELALQIALGVALAVSKGWADPEAERANARARALCSNVEESAKLFAALQGLAAGYCVRGDIRMSLELTEQALRLAERRNDPTLLVIGHFNVGDQLFWFPELAAAQRHLEEGLSRFEPRRDRRPALTTLGWDPGVACLTFRSRILWHLGYPDQAATCADRATAMAEEIAHPFSQSWALSWGAALYQLRREAQRVRQLADATVTLASEQVIPFFGAHGMVLRGWALVNQGHGDEGIAQLRSGIAAYRATGAVIECSHWLGLLAEACGEVDQPAEGLRLLDEALAEIERNDVRYYEAELYRLRGELLLKQDVANEQEADACFRRAIDVARGQQARSLELRAVASLSCLWQRQDKREEARRLLAGVYNWFTEGFDTVDLKEARALLEQLS